MKNQYFGDKRDYFKYAVLQLLTQTLGYERLTCVWMLTPSDGGRDGRKAIRPIPGLSALADFLSQCRRAGLQDVRSMRSYFPSVGIEYCPYRDGPEDLLTSANRIEYFASIPDDYLRDALLFFDPDNGMEPRARFTPAHLRYAELRSVFDRLSPKSAVVIYQHLPRVPAASFWPRIVGQVSDVLGSPVVAVTEPDMGFIVADRSGRIDELESSLYDHIGAATSVGLRMQLFRS